MLAVCQAGNMPQTLERTDTYRVVSPDVPWVTLVWNDPVNLMTYVSYVFRSYFGYPKAEADRLMLQVHNNGRSFVATGPREEMERHVEAMHDYGLWATVTKADS
jgi:ATP-dependent Clp protease adaptor protein ClpS